MKKFLHFLDGKKRGIAAVAGAILPWCYKYQVMPERFLELAAIGLGLFTSWAVGHAVLKKRGAVEAEAPPEE